ncbi:McrB family protein [Clostridium tertium]|uniref:McrB family protein n=1 Tax=Clostridium tertium TaxID=1559 RepID=UPI001FA84163|nr:AAA family ATPase [Clostridium tertium]MDB1939486.1 AAA family ATPase [Clostridium tertium]
MAKFYILSIDNLIQTFTVLDSGKKITFGFSTQYNDDAFRNINSGDLILGFINSPTNKVKMLFEVIGIDSNNQVELLKKVDVDEGICVDDTTILDKLHKNEIIELSEDGFNVIYNKLIRSLFNTSNINNVDVIRNIKFKTGYQSDFERNRIVFGAPGTGKSFKVNKERKELLGEDNDSDYERVTFHPDYSYSHFVGTYKPVPCKDSDDKETITYEYVPGPFMRTLVKALQNSKGDNTKPYLLIIEEINRANVAAVFGDVFQLLDRGEDGVSEYPITTSKDMRTYLAKEENLGGNPEDYEKIRIPDNMFIWATMNSADQGVFPMDTAFKRRWDFNYLGINDGDKEIKGRRVTLGTGAYARFIEWNELRKAINDTLSTYKINEDKLLGPYFLSKKIINSGTDTEIDAKTFISSFKNKVIMYLFDDAAKQKRTSLFEGCKDTTKYSSICMEFDKRGVEIFCKEIRDKFPKTASDTKYSAGAEE